MNAINTTRLQPSPPSTSQSDPLDDRIVALDRVLRAKRKVVQARDALFEAEKALSDAHANYGRVVAGS